MKKSPQDTHTEHIDNKGIMGESITEDRERPKKTADTPMRRSRNSPIVTTINQEWMLDDGPFRLHKHQRKILNHVFRKRSPKSGVKGSLPYRTAIYSCPKKSGKTEVSAAVAWAWAVNYGGLVLSVANDKDQATNNMFSRVLAYTRRLEKHDRDRYHQLVGRRTADTIEFLDRPGIPATTIRAIPCDPYGEAGHELLSLVCYDELWAYGRSDITWRLWTELQPIPTLEHSMRWVTTYAGFYGESEVLYSVFEQACKPDPQNPDLFNGHTPPDLEGLPCYAEESLFAYWDRKPRMPWHTPEFLQQAKDDPVNKLRPAEFKRLWENGWSTGLDAFLDIEILDQLIDQGQQRGLHNHYP